MPYHSCTVLTIKDWKTSYWTILCSACNARKSFFLIEFTKKVNTEGSKGEAPIPFVEIVGASNKAAFSWCCGIVNTCKTKQILGKSLFLLLAVCEC